MLHRISCIAASLLLIVPLLQAQPAYAPEKVYVHLDRTYFAAGETLWLKAYVESAVPVPDSSRFLYVELLDGESGEAERFTPPLEGTGEAEPLLIPMIDARRMEVYSAVYDRALQEVRPIGADVVDADTYLPYLEEHPVWFFGDGSEKCKNVIKHKNAHFIDGIMPLAKWMFPLAERSLHLGETQDVAYFEPFYFKEYVAKTPLSPFKGNK